MSLEPEDGVGTGDHKLTPKQRVGKWLFARMPISRFLFDQLRAEANAAEVWAMNRAWPPQRALLRKIRKSSALRVNVGCGPHCEPGFVNLDLMATVPGVLRWDCRRSLPLRDESAIGIRIEHFLEHVETREELPSLLAECLRTLVPGGTLRVIVPDARRYVEAYLRNDAAAFEPLGIQGPWPDDLPTRMDVVNHVFHQAHEHRYGYDFESLAHRLKAAGFVDVVQTRFRESRDPALACDLEVHAPYSLYVEARKPQVP